MGASSAVVIPVHNGEQFLAAAIDSALHQTRRPERVLVVDDASTDGTVALAEGYASRGHPVEVLTSHTNQGPGAARNRGIEHASTEFILFLDADDRWLPEHCATVLGALEDHVRAGFSYSARMPRASDRPAVPAAARTILHDCVCSLIVDNRVPQSAVAARRSAVLDVGGYDREGRHAEDYDLWLRMAFVAPFVEVPVRTYERGIHDGQASLDEAAMYRGAWRARTRLRDFASSRELPIPHGCWEEAFQRAFENDLEMAWQSRSLTVLEAVLALHDLVPGGDVAYRKWRRRRRLIWPAWRMAAFGWDALPETVRTRIRKLRGVPVATAS